MNRRRVLIVVFVLGIGTALVLGRAVQVSVLDHEKWQKKALVQQREVIDVSGPRGTISTSDGYVLATSIERVTIQVNSKYLAYPDLFVDAASPILGIPETELNRRLGPRTRSVWLAKRVPRDIAEQIRDLASGSVVLVPDFARIYPQGALAAPVIGFIGFEDLNAIGRAGLEYSYDAYLAGEPEQYLSINDAIARKVRVESLHRGRAGLDLELTLNARLQARCESVLEAALQSSGARAASAVVVEVNSGRILALASLPAFNPANPGAVKAENWRLRPVQDAFEPGSTVKPLVAAAALSAGVVRRGEKFDCLEKGTRVAGHWIRDHADPGSYTLDEVVVYSANVGIIKVGERVEPTMLWQAFDAFGCGRRTGIDFPAEARGLLPQTRTWSKMSAASFSLGQELTMSPLQMAMAYSAIANGGWLLKPSLIASGSSNGVAKGNVPRTRVMDDRLALRLQTMLEGVVVEGTGKLARVPGYRVAGKTGTAQRAVNGGFDDQHHVAWFAGFLPMPDPKIVVVVAVEDPAERDFWASTVAAPIFADIAGAAAGLLDLPPTEAVEPPPSQIVRGEGSIAGTDA